MNTFGVYNSIRRNQMELSEFKSEIIKNTNSMILRVKVEEKPKIIVPLDKDRCIYLNRAYIVNLSEGDISNISFYIKTLSGDVICHLENIKCSSEYKIQFDNLKDDLVAIHYENPVSKGISQVELEFKDQIDNEKIINAITGEIK